MNMGKLTKHGEQSTGVLAPGAVFEHLEPRLLLSGDPLSAAQVVDNGDGGFDVVGSWALSTSGGHEGDYLSTTSEAGVALWTFEGLTPGYRYRISTTWTAGPDRAGSARYTIANRVNADIEDALAAVAMDQTLAPDDFTEAGTVWEDLGEPYFVRGTTLSIRLSGDAGGTVVADAIRIERVGTWVPPVGVPAPEFGIEQTHWMYADPRYTYDYGSGPEAYRMGSSGPYTHYVDPQHPNATNSNNPYGTPQTPRATIPTSLSPGSVVEVHGRHDYFSELVVTGNGTSSNPVFLRGPGTSSRPVLTGKLRISGSYIIAENLEFADRDGDLSGGAYGKVNILDPADHACVRHCDIHGNLGGGGAGFSSWYGNSLDNVVLYNNLVHDNGDVDADFDQDIHGIHVTKRVSNGWVVDNQMYRNSGDGIQINAGSLTMQATTHHIYVGRNTAHHNKQSGMWTKQAVDVIFSQNLAYSHVYSDSSLGQGMGFQYAPERVWFLFNHIYDCEYGISATSNSGMGFGENSYLIGNLIHDIHHTNPAYNPETSWANAGILMVGGVYRHIVNNTIYDVDAGINGAGGSGFYNMVNNIISDVVEPQGEHVFLEFGSAASASSLNNNLFYQGGDPIRIRWGGSTVYDLGAFQTVTGKAEGSVDADPLFVAAESDDFHLRDQSGQVSPAIDAGASIQDYVNLFYGLYGLNIGVDFDGVARPAGSVPDMGALEAVGTGPPVDNDAPVAADLSVTTDEDSPVSGSVGATDADGDALTFSLFSGPANGAASLNANGTFTYTPEADWHGEDSFTFRAHDGWEYSVAATVTVTVTSLPDAPVANDDTASTEMNGAVTVDVLANDTDADGDALAVADVVQPAHGTVVDNGDGTLTYTPEADWSGQDSFSYTVSDGQGGTDSASVGITVASPTTMTSQDIGGVGAAGSASYNDATGVYTVTGSGQDIGGAADEFQYMYQTLNGDGAIYARVLSIANTHPWAKAGAMIRETLDPNSRNALMLVTPEMGTSFQLRASTGAETSYTDLLDGVAAPHWVKVVRSGNTFSGYKSSDGTNWTLVNAATIAMSDVVYVGLAVSSLNDGVLCEAQFDNVTVLGDTDGNHSPVAAEDSVTTGEGIAVTVNVVANDTDADGDALTISAFTQPSHGAVTDNGDGTLTYTPKFPYAGQDTFTYTISDGSGGTGTATVQVTVELVGPEGEMPRLLFDESLYLAWNLDVQGAVEAGVFRSGLQHFLRFGQSEGRNFSPYYNEAHYLAHNPDVAQAVGPGKTWDSGFEHFLLFGQYEGRDSSPYYGNGYYLATYSDVRGAVEAGVFRSGLQHFLRFGQYEGRNFSPYYNEVHYLAHNADVAQAVGPGKTWNSGFEHFLALGQYEGRSASTNFDESYYLAANADVQAAVSAGVFRSGLRHFLLFGQYEGRAHSP